MSVYDDYDENDIEEIVAYLADSLSRYGLDIDEDVPKDDLEKMIGEMAARVYDGGEHGDKDMCGFAEEAVEDFANRAIMNNTPVLSGDNENIIVSLNGDREYIEAQMSQDPAYPGVDIQFNDPGAGGPQPRVLFEMCDGELRALVWNDFKEGAECDEETSFGQFNAPFGDAYVANVRNGYFEVIVPGTGRFAAFSINLEQNSCYGAFQLGGIAARFMPEGSNRLHDIIMSMGHDGVTAMVGCSRGLEDSDLVFLPTTEIEVPVQDDELVL